MEKKTIAVIFGSDSSEYEISLRSATSVLQNLPKDQFTVIMLGITKQGHWLEYTGEIADIVTDQWHKTEYVTPAIISPDRSVRGMVRFAANGVEQVKLDAVFPVLHGEHGEDGTIQGLLELAGIPYVGCHLLASAGCMDKAVTHTLLEAAGITTAPFAALVREQLSVLDVLEPDLAKALGYPMFVKPANTGSSVGVSKVKNPAELRAALELAFRYDRKAVVEKAITGAEVECAVLGNYTDTDASVIGEIVPHHEFYDYEGKYLDDSTDLYIPARISEEISTRIQKIARDAFAAMGCTGLARVDFFVTPQEEIILNEINTIPGFTSISMYPKLFEATGIGYGELLTRLIGLALDCKA